MLYEKLDVMKKALDGFIPLVKNMEGEIGVLEGKTDNLRLKRENLEKEIVEKIKISDEVIALDNKRAKEHLVQTEKYLKEAYEIYLMLYKQKATMSRVAPEQAQKIAESIEKKQKDLKEYKEAAVI